MAEAAAQEAPAGAKAKSKKGIILLAALVLVGAGAFFAMKTMSSPASATPVEEPTPEEGEILDVAEMTASLPGEPAHMARVGFAVVLSADADATAVTSKFALLKDAAVSELARSSADALVTPEGVDDLRARLSDRADDIYPAGEVLRVVLTGLVVQ